MQTLDLEEQVRRIIRLSLEEDRADEDITTQSCIDKSVPVRAELLLKEKARIAGLIFLPWILDAVHISSVEIHAQEGALCEAGTKLASIVGNAHSLFSVERCLLNLLQHTSGIANGTAQFVERIEGLTCAILDTRKTLPGLRAIQKYAVRIGGGKNHRLDLKERILIKNNHLSLMGNANPIRTSIDKARRHSPGVSLEIEVHHIQQLQEALDAAPDAILLDNMTPESVAQAVQVTQRKVYLEASGGITLSNVRAYAETGVDAISIGALTHSVRAVDISLRM